MDLAGFDGRDLGQWLVLTSILGGAAAWATGKAIAEAWKPAWQFVWYTALLAAAVRFFHYALFEKPLLGPLEYAADAAYLLIVAWMGYRHTRERQMREQYGWIERS